MEGYVETMFEILTTRFNSITYREMESWKEREEYRGSIYNTQSNDRFNKSKSLFVVLEMNNTLNKIIKGLIKSGHIMNLDLKKFTMIIDLITIHTRASFM